MTYEERRMKLAFDFDDMENADEYDAAEFTIKKQEEAIREVFEYIFGDRLDIDPDIFLKQNGYIPEKGGE